PFEGLLFCIPVALALLFWVLRLRRSNQPLPLSRVVWPISTCLLATVAFTLYYNSRLTGEALLFPRTLYYRQYFTVSPFICGKIPAPAHYATPQFEVYFNTWLRSQFNGPLAVLRRIEFERFRWLFQFFVGGLYALPFVTLPGLVRSRRTRLVLAQL